MPTFKTEIQNKRADGTYNIRIRVTHNREVRRISTHLYVDEAEITKSKKIKNTQVLELCEDEIRKCRDYCNKAGFEILTMPIDELVDRLKNTLQGGDRFYLDFFDYSAPKIAEMVEGSAKNYRSALSALKRFLKRDKLDISEINKPFINAFKAFIEKEPSQRGSNRKADKQELTPKGTRAVSMYLSCIRSLYNKAKEEYNDEDRGIIPIPWSPFTGINVKQPAQNRKRALSVEQIQAIIDIPYKEEKSGHQWNRFNLAKDCFILSFALIGMNSADLYHAPMAAKDIIIYNRKKTEDRRDDSAEMRVKMHPCIGFLTEKYEGIERLFNFHLHYSNHNTFNDALNEGLKQIGEKIGIEKLEFYAARHSWATIARSAAVSIDKFTVHEALNHSDQVMKITDKYIDKDWRVIWKANNRVLDLFDWSATGVNLL
jgi:integrase